MFHLTLGHPQTCVSMTYTHKTMVSIASLEKIEIIRSQEFMLSEVRLKFCEKKFFKGLKLTFWGLNFVEFWCLGLSFGGQWGLDPQGPLDPVLAEVKGEPGYQFNPCGWITDEAGANFNGIGMAYGQQALQKSFSCRFHYTQCLNNLL